MCSKNHKKIKTPEHTPRTPTMPYYDFQIDLNQCETKEDAEKYVATFRRNQNRLQRILDEVIRLLWKVGKLRLEKMIETQQEYEPYEIIYRKLKNVEIALSTRIRTVYKIPRKR